MVSEQNTTQNFLAPEQNYRVVQWATANIGAHSLRAVIEHPNMTLVGVYVYSDEKVGRDADELFGFGTVTAIPLISAAAPGIPTTLASLTSLLNSHKPRCGLLTYCSGRDTA